MKRATLLALVAGVLLFVGLLSHYGIARLAAAVVAADWGLFWVALYRFVTLATDAAGWRVLFTSGIRPPFGPLLRLRWIGESVNSLLPVAQVGGEVVRARLAGELGVGGVEAGATVVVDFTLGLVTQLLYTLLGVGYWCRRQAARRRAAGCSDCCWPGWVSPPSIWRSAPLFSAPGGNLSRPAGREAGGVADRRCRAA